MRVTKLKKVALAFVLGLGLTMGVPIGVINADPGGSTLDALSMGESGGVQTYANTGVGSGGAEIQIPESDQEALAAIAAKINEGQKELKGATAGDMLDGAKLFTVSEEGTEIVFNAGAFSRASEKTVKQNMQVFVDELQSSQVSPETQQYIFDLISGANRDASVILVPMLMDSTSADLYTAMNIVDPFLQFMRVVFGLGAIVIVLLLATSTIIDLCYIGLPMARGDEKDGKPGLPFVSWDAESVVKEVESSLGGDGGYKNAYVIYFKRRAFTYIILAICLLYLVAGELGGVISWFLNLASGLV